MNQIKVDFMLFIKIVLLILEIVISFPALVIGFFTQCYIDTFAGGRRLKTGMDTWLDF